MDSYVYKQTFTFVCFREKVAMLESVESQMKLERRTRVESDAQVKELEARQAEAQLKSQQIIAGLKTQVAEQTQMRVSLDGYCSYFFIPFSFSISVLSFSLHVSISVLRK